MIKNYIQKNFSLLLFQQPSLSGCSSKGEKTIRQEWKLTRKRIMPPPLNPTPLPSRRTTEKPIIISTSLWHMWRQVNTKMH